ncbi:MAG: DUF937 domain-containing protein [Alphaproteobacteria bacterium]|nr:DUF937 domain-containing protein [Alphaproteobacteria bacterium]
MGLLDEIMGGLPQEHATATGGGGLPNAIMGLLANRQSGGLNGLMGSFAAAGLGHVFQSWVGNGPNQSISPQDLHRALGEDKVQAMANQTGMSTSQLLPLLAQFLPTIIDRLTPQGQMPPADFVPNEGTVRT